MSTYSEQINTILHDNLVPKMQVLSMDIAKYEPYSYTSTTLEDKRRQLDYYSMLYDFLSEYADGSEELTSVKLTNIVRLIEPPSREKKYFNLNETKPVAKPSNRFIYYIDDLEVTAQTLLVPDTEVTITVVYDYHGYVNGTKEIVSLLPIQTISSGWKLTIPNFYISWAWAGSALDVSVETYAGGDLYSDGAIQINIGYMTNKIFYYGSGAQGLTPAEIVYLDKVIEDKSNKTFKFSPNSEVFYFAYPAAYGLLTSILDHNGFDMISDFIQTTELLTTGYSYGTQSYYVYEYDMPTIQTNFNITFNF